MSYIYRNKKRKACHLILKYLVEHDVQRDPSWEPLEERETVSINTFINNTKYDYKILYPAVHLLARNEQIEYNDRNGFLDDNSDLELLPAARRHFMKAFISQRIKKIFLFQLSLTPKWIIPIISLLISFIALGISIFRK
jgi:hypothetical protein